METEKYKKRIEMCIPRSICISKCIHYKIVVQMKPVRGLGEGVETAKNSAHVR